MLRVKWDTSHQVTDSEPGHTKYPHILVISNFIAGKNLYAIENNFHDFLYPFMISVQPSFLPSFDPLFLLSIFILLFFPSHHFPFLNLFFPAFFSTFLWSKSIYWIYITLPNVEESTKKEGNKICLKWAVIKQVT